MGKDSARRREENSAAEEGGQSTAEDAPRAALGAILKEKGWNPKVWDGDGRRWEAVSPDGSHDVWAFPAEEAGASREALCHVNAVGNDTGMWVLNVPSTGEAARLLEEREDLAASWSAKGHSILDLATGAVLTEPEAQRLLKNPVPEMLGSARRALTSREEVVRELLAAGWEPRWMLLGYLDRGASVTQVTAYGEHSGPGRDRALLLHVHLSQGGVWYCSVEDPGHGAEIPVGDRPANAPIPTPDEAREAHAEGFARVRVERREMLVYAGPWARTGKDRR